MDSSTLSHADQRRRPNAAEFLKYIRIKNMVLTIFFVFLVPLYVIGLSVVYDKNEEVVKKLDLEHERYILINDDYYRNDNDDFCIFFIDKDHSDFSDIEDCYFIINGSGAMAGCALLMIIFLVFRIVVKRCHHDAFV